MAQSSTAALIEQFWALFNQNDFRAAAEQTFHDAYTLEWPQSGELIRGRENWIAINEHYPANGMWHATLHRLIADDDQAVTEATITDTVISARVITFSEVRGGRIWRQVEYWPDPFPAAEWRAQWVERVSKG